MPQTLDQHIERNSTIRGGRPCIAGTRITVDDVAIMHIHVGYSIEEIVGNLMLQPAAVHAALAYYYDHKVEIDQQITADEARFETFKRDTPSLLREKLRALGLAI